jgi:hypothetical protein
VRFATTVGEVTLQGVVLVLTTVGLLIGFTVRNKWACGRPVMTDPDTTARVIRQGKALVRAIESLITIEPSGPIERFIVGLLLAAYKRLLRRIVESAPGWVSEETLSASEHIGNDQAMLWMSDN